MPKKPSDKRNTKHEEKTKFTNTRYKPSEPPTCCPLTKTCGTVRLPTRSRRTLCIS